MINGSVLPAAGALTVTGRLLTGLCADSCTTISKNKQLNNPADFENLPPNNI